MKLIEAMKKIKELQVKADDLSSKVKTNSANLNVETPLYPDTAKQIREWIQAHSDVLKEVLRLRVAIQSTNLVTMVAVELDGNSVVKSIAAWIHRRRDLATAEQTIWAGLTDRGLKEGNFQPSVPGAQGAEIRIRRFFDPIERDAKIELYRSEPSIIDRTLEVVNATTDLLE